MKLALIRFALLPAVALLVFHLVHDLPQRTLATAVKAASMYPPHW